EEAMKILYKKLSIKQKFLMLFSIQIIIPLLFMGMMLYRTSNEIIQKKSIDYSVDILKMIELRFNDFSDNIEVAAQDILYDPIVFEVLEDNANGMHSNMTEIDSMYNSLRKVCLSRDEIQGVTIISSDDLLYNYNSVSGRSNNVSFDDYDALKALTSDSPRQMLWYLEKNEADEVENIYVLRTIYSINQYEELGVLVINLKQEALASVYSNLSTEFMEQIAIVTQNGDYILGTGQPTKERLAQLNELDETTISSYWMDEKSNSLVCYRDVIHPPWRIITEISLAKLNEDMNEFRNYFLVISAVTMLILSVLSLFMAVDIIDPINRLVDAMRHMKKDKVHVEIDVDRKDELGYLSESFNDMSGEIDFLVNQVYKEQLTRKEAELKTLQAQINPHFLFNTLESINWLARLNEVPEISQMVTALSALIEAGIGKGIPLVALREEIDFVDSYFLIMMNRYGGRLTFTKNIDHTVLDVKVPKLMLQPVLENAIYHGIDKNRKKGEISLDIHRKDGNIRIEIIDNGHGMNTDQLKDLNEQMSSKEDDYLIEEHGNTGGIGLRNVNRRLKLFFGQEYGIRVESKLLKYTKVIITVPFDDHTLGVKHV
ncbi:MAG: sensor histidine kinase, partial [Vallitaleaceae bacterium]|nr:sensor histidine kinase [Vallitaleaceae bacterium]